MEVFDSRMETVAGVGPGQLTRLRKQIQIQIQRQIKRQIQRQMQRQRPGQHPCLRGENAEDRWAGDYPILSLFEERNPKI